MSQAVGQRLLLRTLIYGLLLFTFFAGLPQFHYAAAVMIALMLRYKDKPNPLLTPVFTSEAASPAFTPLQGVGARAFAKVELPAKREE